MAEKRGEAAKLREGAEQPEGGYLALFAIYACAVGLGAWLLRDRIRRSEIKPGDIVLVGAATHKIARLVSKDEVLIPLRAPFVGARKPVGDGEVEEEARGTGLRLAIGKLLTCPYCLAPWVATGLTAGLLAKPKFARAVASIFTAVGIADLLHLAYGKMKDHSPNRDGAGP